jgi:hypothetical protein
MGEDENNQNGGRMTNDELDRTVLYIMLRHQGKKNRVGRWELVEQVFGVPVPAQEQNDDNLLDREIRYSIGRLRAQGYLICDLGDGAGRWMAATEAEFWEFYSYYVKPIKSRAEVARALKSAAQKQFPNLMQPSLLDYAEMEGV